MSTVTDLDLDQIKLFYVIHKFHGFDIKKVREEFENKISDRKTQIEILTALSCTSPKRAEFVILRNGKSLSQMGITHGNRKGLSPSRLIAAFAVDIVKIRKMTAQPKRIEEIKCPAEFQVLGVGRAVPKDQQDLYKEFCSEFTKIIKSELKNDLFQLSLR